MLKQCVPIGFLALLFAVAAAPAYPAGAKGPQGTTYASLAELPDWSGTWVMSDRAFQASGKIADKAPYKAAYLQTQQQATSDTGKP